MPGIQFNGICSCVFDAYGTFFDMHSAAVCWDELGDKADPLPTIRRHKQLKYT